MDHAIRIYQGDAGMWFARRENDAPIFVAAKSLEAVCKLLPHAEQLASAPTRTPG